MFLYEERVSALFPGWVELHSHIVGNSKEPYLKWICSFILKLNEDGSQASSKHNSCKIEERTLY